MSTLKNKYWFAHPADLRHDRRMRRAMSDFPNGVGYGLIVLLIEHLRCQPNYSYPLQDLDLLAKEFETSLPILQTLITKYEFFEIIENEKEELFISPMLNDLMKPYDEKVEKNRLAGIKSAEKRKEKMKKLIVEAQKKDKKLDYIDVDEIPDVV